MDGAIDPIKFPPFSMGVQSPGGVKYQQGRGGVGEGKGGVGAVYKGRRGSRLGEE